MRQVIKNAFVLFAITLVAGLAIGAVYEFTEESRNAKQEEAKNDACKIVMSGADTFEDISYDRQEAEEYVVSCGIASGVFSVDSISAGKDSNGDTIGYAVTVTDSEGYGGDIQVVVGILNDGTVSGVSILSISETAGLGMKANDDSFLGQFAGKAVEKFSYTKSGAQADDEIDAISGATITTNAMTNGVNAAIYTFNYINSLSGGNVNE